MAELFIVSIQHIESHTLELTFNDKHIQRVDFTRFIFSNTHPDYQHYKSVSKF